MDEEVTRIVPSQGGEAVQHQDAKNKEVPTVGPGSQLGSYRLDQLIAGGMSGEIYKGHNLTANKPCVVKVFRGELDLGPAEFGRYVHENRLLSPLALPPIAELFFSGKVNGRHISVMNTLSGDPLRSVVRQKAPLSQSFYLPVLRSICGALAEVHDLGLFHGHLHGGQVLLRFQDQQPRVTLLDFGVRHLLPGVKEPISGWERKAEQAIYLAPEQAKGLPGDARSDIYALSVLLYEMVTGKVPFLAGDFGETLEQIANEPPVAPGKLADIPEAVEEVILRGLEKDPRGRLPSVEAFYAALDPRGLEANKPSADSGAVAGTGRHAVLIHGPADGEELSGRETSGQLPPPLPLDALEDEVVKGPRRRLWIILAVLFFLLIGCGAAAFFLTGGGEEKAIRKKSARMAKRARPKRAKKTKPRAVKAKRIKAEPIKAKPVKAEPIKAKIAPAPPPQPAAEPEPEPEAAREPAPPPPAAAAAKALSVRSAVHPAVAAGMIKKVEGYGSLRVVTGAREGRVFVDGNLRGAGEAVVLKNIPVGTHRITVEKEGNKLPHQDVQIMADQRLDVSF